MHIFSYQVSIYLHLLLFLLKLLSYQVVFEVEFGNFSLFSLARLLLITLRLVSVLVLKECLVVALLE